MGALTTAGTGSSLGATGAFGLTAKSGAGAGAALGLVTGYMDYKNAKKQAAYNRELLDRKVIALDNEFEASNKLLESKYNLKLSGFKSKKVDLTDEVLTELDTASIQANQELSKLLAVSVGSGVTGNVRNRLQSAANQTAELTRTNMYMQGKRQEAQITEAGFAAKSETLATQEFKQVQYQSQRDLIAFERANIQDSSALSIFL